MSLHHTADQLEKHHEAEGRTTMQRHNLAVRLALPVLAAIGLVGPVPASPRDLAPPDEAGPYNVGVTTFSAPMSAGRVTRIQVYYPTFEPADEESRYTILTPAGSFQLGSPLGAMTDAQAAPGLFPLVVHEHGGQPAGADFQRVAQLSLHETMASHGFVVAVALHSANAVARVRDLSLVIDVMLIRSGMDGDLLSESIDPARIGISGYSAGGGAAIGAAGGWAANGIAADLRIKAMVIYEPAILSLDDASTVTVPYLVMGGAQNKWGLAAPSLFDATVLATHRIYVLTPSATHFNYLTDMGAEIDQTREAALLVDPGIPEPLTVRTPTNAAAARAYELWNMGETLFPALGPGAGSGRNFCDRVGVVSVRSLDVNPPDGFTDTPPFMAEDPLLLQPAIPEEVMVPLIKLYTIAFWKSFLEGDRRYMPYLTPGYAQRNDLEALIDIE
jgi:predicted dienelactone hydrolase